MSGQIYTLFTRSCIHFHPKHPLLHHHQPPPPPSPPAAHSSWMKYSSRRRHLHRPDLRPPSSYVREGPRGRNDVNAGSRPVPPATMTLRGSCLSPAPRLNKLATTRILGNVLGNKTKATQTSSTLTRTCRRCALNKTTTTRRTLHNI